MGFLPHISQTFAIIEDPPMQNVDKPCNVDVKTFLYHTTEQLTKLFGAPKSAVPIPTVTICEIEAPSAEGLFRKEDNRLFYRFP
jgi:hypothetical protein